MVSTRTALHVPAFVIAIFGFIFVWASLATPAWQVVYAIELQQTIQSGLWISCQTRPAGMSTCTYTFTRGDFDFYTSSAEGTNLRTPAFFQWQRTLMHIILVAQLAAFFALISFCLSHARAATKCASIVFSITIGLAGLLAHLQTIASLSALLALGSNVAFAMYSQMVQYRFYTVSVSGIYEKHWGYSYYLELIGALLYGVSFIISVCLAVHLLRRDSMADNDQHKQYIPRWQQQYRMDPDDEYFAMRDLPDIPRKR